MARAWTLLPLLLLLAAPAQAALTVQVTAPANPLRVGLDVGEVTVTATIDCASVLLRADPMSLQAPVPLHVGAWTGAPSVTLEGPSTVGVPTGACQGASTVRVATTFFATVGDGAVGGEPQEVRALLHLDNVSLDPAAATATVRLTAAPFRVAAYEVPLQLQECLCDRLSYTVRVANLGNVATGYRFELARAPTQGTVELPAPLQLQPRQAGGENAANATITYVSPGGRWSQQLFEVKVVPLSGEGALPGGQAFSFVAVRLEEKNTSPAPAAALLGLLLLGLARRRA